MSASRTIVLAGKRIADRLGFPTYWLQQCGDEFNAAIVRMWAMLPMQRRRIRRLLARDTVRLNLGCGETTFPGWIGVDQFFGGEVELVLDLRRPLPFPDASVDYCYSEHFLEHLDPIEGLRHLKEVRRILKPHGRYRVVVPDVLKFARHYLEGDDAFFRLAFPWAERPMEALYAVANWGGRHRNILDHAELRHMGEQAGFAAMRSCSAYGSLVPDLRIDSQNPQRIAESLYFEFARSDANAASGAEVAHASSAD